MTSSQKTEINTEIARFLGCFVREADKYDGSIVVEIYDKEFLKYCSRNKSGCGVSHNPAMPFHVVNTLFGKKEERIWVDWTDLENLRFHESWDWFMMAWKAAQTKIEGFNEDKSGIRTFVNSTNLTMASQCLCTLIKKYHKRQLKMAKKLAKKQEDGQY
jgi:hypothetical protein